METSGASGVNPQGPLETHAGLVGQLAEKEKGGVLRSNPDSAPF